MQSIQFDGEFGSWANYLYLLREKVCEHSRALRCWSDHQVELIRGVADLVSDRY
ncbi:MAG: hypothetical protein HWQ41_24825 [Nostoc sp. NOS(2021)]|uniref:hypothetical protein n=1 Tax=Nostoc sp. NOS(2021) TaxID=2815407 RepID=UPI0025D5993D|nr:hypothetical protein [Nostoc sp. NOS(2021)]MBN3898378.1 hypothetical protein [Nostoc sp. NOS(2021)]